MQKHTSTTLIVAFAAIMGTVGAARADYVLDQTFVPDVPDVVPLHYPRLAQTFTVGADGDLGFVDLLLLRGQIAPTLDLTFEIRRAVGSNPNETTPSTDPADLLLTRTIAPSSIPVQVDFVRVDFRDTPLAVEAGDRLALVLIILQSEGQHSRTIWVGNNGQNNTGGYAFGTFCAYGVFFPGNFWVNGPSDGGFRTFVQGPSAVPEPSSLAMAGAGLIAIAGLARHRRSSGR